MLHICLRGLFVLSSLHELILVLIKNNMNSTGYEPRWFVVFSGSNRSEFKLLAESVESIVYQHFQKLIGVDAVVPHNDGSNQDAISQNRQFYGWLIAHTSDRARELVMTKVGDGVAAWKVLKDEYKVTDELILEEKIVLFAQPEKMFEHCKGDCIRFLDSMAEIYAKIKESDTALQMLTIRLVEKGLPKEFEAVKATRVLNKIADLEEVIGRVKAYALEVERGKGAETKEPESRAVKKEEVMLTKVEAEADVTKGAKYKSQNEMYRCRDGKLKKCFDRTRGALCFRCEEYGHKSFQ